MQQESIMLQLKYSREKKIDAFTKWLIENGDIDKFIISFFQTS